MARVGSHHWRHGHGLVTDRLDGDDMAQPGRNYPLQLDNHHVSIICDGLRGELSQNGSALCGIPKSRVMYPCPLLTGHCAVPHSRSGLVNSDPFGCRVHHSRCGALFKCPTS